MTVAGGLLIAYSAWLIVNMFFLVVGVSDWEGFDGGWWEINCPEEAKNILEIGCGLGRVLNALDSPDRALDLNSDLLF